MRTYLWRTIIRSKINPKSSLTNKRPQKSRRILGIDPGTNILGWGIVESEGKSLKLVDLGHLNMSKIQDPYEKLSEIYSSVSKIIDNYKPTESSFESPFHGKNVQSMLKLGRAQGVAIAACFAKGLQVAEYAPKKIKQSVTGNGNASKEQLAKMLQSLLNLKEIPKYLDATDGVATAVCHFNQNGMLSSMGSKYSGWAGFIQQNKTRIKE